MEEVYVIPLRKVKDVPRTIRAPRAARYIKEFLRRHTKSDNIKLDSSVNEKIWERGIQKIPSKIKVKTKKEDDTVVVTLAE